MHPHTFLETLQEYEKGDLVMIATKDEERKVLEQIRRLIDGIGGTDSYIGAALEGCLEIAEENIRNAGEKLFRTATGKRLLREIYRG